MTRYTERELNKMFLDRLQAERDQAVALLRWWRAAFWTRHDDDTPLATMSIATAEFLESLT